MFEILASGSAGELFTLGNLAAFLALAAMEIVLGIDNIVFLAILTGKLPKQQQAMARRLGLGAAMGMRILLLFSISWIMSLEEPLFRVTLPWPVEVARGPHADGAGAALASGAATTATSAAAAVAAPNYSHGFAGRHLILLAGGLFLLWKATKEIHEKLEVPADEQGHKIKATTFGAVIVQVMILDLVFSIDSVITAVGMVKQIEVMIAAVVLSVVVMMVFAGPVCAFIEKHPTMKMLALSFLVLIGVMLIAEGVGGHIPKGYIYFAMVFSLGVEFLNVMVRRKSAQPVHLHTPELPPQDRQGT